MLNEFLDKHKKYINILYIFKNIFFYIFLVNLTLLAILVGITKWDWQILPKFITIYDLPLLIFYIFSVSFTLYFIILIKIKDFELHLKLKNKDDIYY
jgi:hypothetical protein